MQCGCASASGEFDPLLGMGCGEEDCPVLGWSAPHSEGNVMIGVTYCVTTNRYRRSSGDDVVRVCGVGMEYKTYQDGSPSLSSLTYNSHPDGFHRFRHLQGKFVPHQLPPNQTHFQSHRSCTSSLEPELVLDKRVSFFASFAVLLPPLGVALEKGCGADFCINILLVRLPYLLPLRPG